MTTICFKAGVLAADSKMNAGSGHAGKVQKIVRIGKGNMAAGAGEFQSVVAFMNWLREGKPEDKKPVMDNSFCGVQIVAGETFWFDDRLVAFQFEPHKGVWAIGSGSEYALGAMLAGASAKKACTIACEMDNGSDLPVQIMRARV